jgi:hypothetical protein
MEVEVVEEDEEDEKDCHHRLGGEEKELPIDPNKQRRRHKNRATIVTSKPSQCQ